MAADSHILAWRIPMDRGVWWAAVHGVARVGHNRSTNHSTAHGTNEEPDVRSRGLGFRSCILIPV